MDSTQKIGDGLALCAHCKTATIKAPMAGAYTHLRICKPCKNRHQTASRARNEARNNLQPRPTNSYCSRCEQTKPVNEFHIDRGSATGCHSQCKACRKQSRSCKRATGCIWPCEACIKHRTLKNSAFASDSHK